MAGLLLEQTESTLSTLLVVHSNFSYVKVLMMFTKAWGPPLARMISYNKDDIMSNYKMPAKQNDEAHKMYQVHAKK